MMPDLANWGVRLDAAVCEKCDWSYLLPAGSPPQRCPHCYQTTLTPIEESFEQLAYTQPPELVIKAAVTQDTAAAQIQKFAKGIPFSPKDLTPENLASRLRNTYIPLWLVDGQVQATWQAEMGFDYQVVSHREKYDAGSWNNWINIINYGFLFNWYRFFNFFFNRWVIFEPLLLRDINMSSK
jgi:hypothetical protein